MRITKVKAKDIYGIEGEKDFSLNDRVTALFGHNGAGKSSFVKTLEFAISGQRGPGMIYEGKSSAAAMFETDNGLRIDRMASETGKGGYTQKCWINRRSTPAEQTLSVLADCWNTKTDNIKLLSSSDVESSLDKDAGKILLSYADNKIKKEDVKAALKSFPERPADITNAMVDAMTLPDEISWNDARAINKDALAKRRDAKARFKGLKAAQDNILRRAGGDPKAPDPEAAQKELDMISAQEASSQALKKALDDYNNAISYRNGVLNEITKDEAVIKNSSFSGDLETLKAEQKAVSDSIAEAGRQKASAEAVISSLTPIYNKLGTGVCPIWDRINCTTDMSGAKTFVASQITAAKERLKTAETILASAGEKYDRLNNEVKGAEQVVMLKARVEAMKQALPPEPVKPAQAQIPDYSARKAYLKGAIMCAQERTQALAMTPDIQKIQLEIDYYDFLVKAFSDEGPVVTAIISSYMKALSDAACEAEKDTGIGVVFSYDNGMNISFKAKGSGPRPYATLSSGEKMLAFLTVSDLLHRIASIPVLLLDDLDKLDLENLDRLLTLLDRVGNSYGNIILAGVDHNGVDEILGKHGIRNILKENV